MTAPSGTTASSRALADRALRPDIARVMVAIRPALSASSAAPAPPSPILAPTTAMPERRKRVALGPRLRIEREYQHLSLPRKRLNVSAGTREPLTKERYASILDQIAHAPAAQEFFKTWLSIRADRWTVPEIAATFAACQSDPQATIQRFLHLSLQVATWSQAMVAFEAERGRLGKKDINKDKQRLNVFRRWLTANGRGEQLIDLVSSEAILAFLTHIRIHGAGIGRNRGASPQTHNRYREVIMQFCGVVHLTWPGICDVTKLREQIKQAEVRLEEGRRLGWSQTDEKLYYLATYSVRVALSRGRTPGYRDDVGLALRTSVQSAVDAGDVRERLTVDCLIKDQSNRWILRPGHRSKTITTARHDLSAERVTPVSDELAAELGAYAQKNAAAIAGRGGRLFAHISEGTLRRAHQRLADALGWGPKSKGEKDRITLKDLRHSGPLRWERADRTLADVSKRMGHEDPGTVRHYLRGVPPAEADRITDEHAAAQLCPAPWRLTGTNPCTEPEAAIIERIREEIIAEGATRAARLRGPDTLEPGEEWRRLTTQPVGQRSPFSRRSK